MQTRKAVFAGSWYPGGRNACIDQIEEFIGSHAAAGLPAEPRNGGIVPHAGWYFSGQIACDVIRQLATSGPAEAVLIFGRHLHPGSPGYIMKEGAWETPLGALEVDAPLAAELAARFTFSVETAQRFERDNTIELQLPFIKYFFANARIVPVGVPPAAAALEIGAAAVDIASRMGRKVYVIGSTDLTHYGYNYGFLPHGTGPQALAWVREQNDRRVIDAMLAMNPALVLEEAREHQNACCAGAAAAAVAGGRAMGAARGELLAYATSHDKSPGDSFVGYAGIVF